MGRGHPGAVRTGRPDLWHAVCEGKNANREAAGTVATPPELFHGCGAGIAFVRWWARPELAGGRGHEARHARSLANQQCACIFTHVSVQAVPGGWEASILEGARWGRAGEKRCEKTQV